MNKLWHLHKNGALYTSGNKLPTALTWMNLKSKYAYLNGGNHALFILDFLCYLTNDFNSKQNGPENSELEKRHKVCYFHCSLFKRTEYLKTLLFSCRYHNCLCK